MIVCVCHNVSEKKIERAYDAGMTNFAELRAHLAVGTCCGTCAGCARKVLRQCAEKREATASGVQIFLHQLQLQAEACPL